MRKGQQEMAADLLAAQQRFDAWRAQRVRGARIPEELWTMAVNVAGQFGLGRAVSALHLDYYSLQRRVLASGPAAAEPQRRRPRTPPQVSSAAARPLGSQPQSSPRSSEAFVQLPSLGVSTPSCRLELQTPAGASLRLELLGVSMTDTMLLTRAIWSQL